MMTHKKPTKIISGRWRPIADYSVRGDHKDPTKPVSTIWSGLLVLRIDANMYCRINVIHDDIHTYESHI